MVRPANPLPAKESHMFRSNYAAILAIAAATMLGQSVACKASDVKYEVVGQIPVELRGLDLQDPDAARILLARLDHAAWQACGGDPRFNSDYARRPEQVRRVFQECRENAVARAVKEVGVQTLTQAYNESKSQAPREASTRKPSVGAATNATAGPAKAGHGAGS
jgi:UrcA family protein